MLRTSSLTRLQAVQSAAQSSKDTLHSMSQGSEAQLCRGNHAKKSTITGSEKESMYDSQ